MTELPLPGPGVGEPATAAGAMPETPAPPAPAAARGGVPAPTGEPASAAAAAGGVSALTALSEPSAAGSSAVDAWRRFDRWSSVLFLSVAAVTLVAALTVLGVAEEAGGSTLAWLVAITVATIAVLVVASVGLDRGARWGRTAAVGLLVVMVATDAVRVIIDLTRSTITIPLAGIVALYLLSIRPRPLQRLAGRDRWAALALVGLFLLAGLLPIGAAISGPGAAATAFGATIVGPGAAATAP